MPLVRDGDAEVSVLTPVRHDVDELVEELFTCGDCWYFALVLSRTLDSLGVVNNLALVGFWQDKAHRTGYPTEDFWWSHVMVRLESGLLLDVTGAHTRQDTVVKWGVREIHEFRVRSMADMQRKISCGFVFEDSRDYAEDAVKSLLDTLNLSV